MSLPKSIFLNNATPPHIATLVIIAGISSVPMNIFLPTLPEMAIYFDAPYSAMQLSVTGYLALTAIMQLMIGPISDRFGRRPIMLTGLAVFIIASIGAALSSSFWVFMTWRAVQAIIVVGLVVSRASVRDMVAREKAASIIGYVTMCMAVAPMLSPVFGGYLGSWFGWQSNFHALWIMGLLVFLLAYLDQGETNRHMSTSFFEQAKTYPTLLKSRRFWGYALTAAFSAGSYFAYLGGGPFIGQALYNLTPKEIGMFLMLTPMGYMIGNGISGRFSTQIGIPRMMITGCLINMVPFIICLILLLTGAPSAAAFFGFTFFIGLGNGMTLPNATAGMLDVNPELAGSAAGLGGALLTFGGALFSALSGFLVTTGTTAIPMVSCILLASGTSLLLALYTIRVEIAVRSALT